METRPVTKQSQDWAYADLRQVVAALAAGQVTAIDLLERALARIAERDGEINAVVVHDAARARVAARAADAALQRGERLPLLGVPVTVKESFDVAGLPTTSGDPAYRDLVATKDAAVVDALRRAGAIIVGKTNVPLALGDIQSFNAIYGRSDNPWNPSTTPGGSSGGSAAAVAAGFVALEVGTDIGGSIRIPAHFCGVAAHKPTYGIVSMVGNGVPPGRFAERDLSCAGPLARRAADLSIALDVLINNDPLARKAIHVSLPPARHTALRDFRVLVLREHPLLAASDDATLPLDRVQAILSDAGVKVDTTSDLLPDLVASHKVYQQLLIGTSLAYKPAAFFDTARIAVDALAPDDDSFEAVRVRSSFLSHRDWLLANEARLALRDRWEKLFETYDAVLTPVSVSAAFAHDHSQPRDARFVDVHGSAVPYLNLFVWVGVPTVAGLPATVIPVARNAKGLPVGVQIIGPYLEDKTPLVLAELLEQQLGDFVPPPGW
ncbi:amidase [Pigmentiphaga aceris]|uniref:amidase n=1 Tax=Pigmentiphaga aceris TaxID=1940612 RepID=UPI001FE5BC98|nr:amidase [Pigmentiphaga aceris]